MRMECKVEPLHRNVRCLLGHKWRDVLVRGSGGLANQPSTITAYKECTWCRARHVVQEGPVYQPIDWEWLNWHNRKVCD